MSTEIIKKEPQPQVQLVPTVALDQIISAKKQLDKYITEGLEEGRDYGTIPGTHKPTLYKAGAEQVMAWFNCRPEYEIISEFHNDQLGVHRYAIRCRVINRATDKNLGEGVGSASGNEKKWKRAGDDLDNTILKMAKKRAFVDAALSTFGISDRFTQDLEDQEKPAPKEQPQHHDDVVGVAFEHEELKTKISNQLILLFGTNGRDLADAIEMFSEWRNDEGELKARGVTDLGKLRYDVKEGKKVSQATMFYSRIRELDGDYAKDLLAKWRAAYKQR